MGTIIAHQFSGTRCTPNWKTETYQYYWKNLDYKVVPFDTFPLVRDDRLERRLAPLAAMLDRDDDSPVAGERP